MASPDLPPGLALEPGGVSVYAASELGPGEWPSRGAVALPGAPAGAFVVRLTRSTLGHDPALAAGAWVVFAPIEGDGLEAGDQSSRLLVNAAGAFNATGERWTFGRPSSRTEGKVHILYTFPGAPRSELHPQGDVRVVGRAVGTLVGGVFEPLARRA